jgi:hypothetical protein
MNIEEKVKKWLVNCFLFILVIFNLLLLIHACAILLPILPGGWDLLAFCGAIIGGMITWLGVKKTLNEQKRERDLTTWSKELSILYTILNELSVINDYQVFLSRGKYIKDIDELDRNFKVLNDFGNKLNESMKMMLGIIDWNFYDSIIEKKKELIRRVGANSMIQRIRNYDQAEESRLPPVFRTNITQNYDSLNKLFWDMNDLALSIYNDIDCYRKTIYSNYNMRNDRR